MSLSHVDEAGRARMVDVAAKPLSRRTAVAEGLVRMSQEAFDLVRRNEIEKGDVLRIAEVAGVMGGKRTSDLIPLCHPLALTRVALEFETDTASATVTCRVTVETVGPTGVEMEALQRLWRF